ncbi:MAG: sensor histidine kinase [Candidatus Berkiella sp.]
MSLPGIDFLFDTSPYSPRWLCGHWAPAIGWTHIISDFLIFFAYLCIPVSLLYYQHKIKAIEINYLFYLFAAFIFLCGATHLIEVIIFWKPIYNFAGLVKLLTAMVSLATLLAIILILPTTLKFIKEKLDAKMLKLELESHKAREAEEANLAKDRFLASMSHELRTPLNAIIGYTGTLLMKLPGPLNMEQEKQLKIIQSSSKHLLSLINDVLDLSKVEAGKLEFTLTNTNCTNIIQEVVNTLIPTCNNKGLELKFVPPEKDIFVLSDQRTLKQIVLNLVNNAIKFTDHGKVEIITQYLKLPYKEEVIIKVIDTGIGIKNEDKNKLFQAFEQISIPGTLTEGTGLGLHLSQKLAKLINGRIEFESHFGHGSCFSLTLENKQENNHGDVHTHN